MYKIFLIIFLSLNIDAKDIKPTFILKSNGLVYDFVIDGSKLYVANDEGSVEIFDLNQQKLIDEIFIKPTISTRGELVASKVISVDRYRGKTLMVTTTANGYRNIWLHNGTSSKNIITLKDKMTIKEARFLDENNFIFGTLGYDMIGYSINDNAIAYKNHIEHSSFSDMTLSENKAIMITASESGQVTLSDTKSGKIIKKLDGLNVDNIYKVAYKKGNVITAGQDRRVGIYPKDAKPYYIKSDFLVYSVTLSPNGKIGLYSSGEDNDLQLFNIKTGNKMDKLIGHEAIPSTTKFFDKYGVFSAGYENKIFYWHLE